MTTIGLVLNVATLILLCATWWTLGYRAGMNKTAIPGRTKRSDGPPPKGDWRGQNIDDVKEPATVTIGLRGAAGGIGWSVTIPPDRAQARMDAHTRDMANLAFFGARRGR